MFTVEPADGSQNLDGALCRLRLHGLLLSCAYCVEPRTLSAGSRKSWMDDALEKTFETWMAMANDGVRACQ